MFAFVESSSVLENSVFLFFIAATTIITILIIPFFIMLTSNKFCQIKRFKEEEDYVDEHGKIKKFPSIRDGSKVHLSVIVPSYNEETRLEPMLQEAITFLLERKSRTPGFKFEIIIVNDGSRDETALVAATYTKRYGSDTVRVLNLVKNRGKGGAVRLGVISSRGAVILFADADGATKFADIEKLETELERLIGVHYVKNPEKAGHSAAVVCGSRAHMEEDAIANRSYFRTLLMFGFHFLVRLFTANTIKDTQCGFKMFTNQAASLCFHNMHVERWAFDVELLYISRRFSIPVAEVAVNWTEIEGSKIVPIFSWLQMAIDLFLIWFKYFTGAWDVVTDN